MTNEGDQPSATPVPRRRPRRDRTGAVVTEQLLLNKVETCEALGGMSVKYLEQLMRSGHIHPVINAGRPMFTLEELQRYVAELPDWTPLR